MTTTPTPIPTALETRTFLDRLAKKQRANPAMAVDAVGAAVIRDDPTLYPAALAFQKSLTGARADVVAKSGALPVDADLAVAVAKSALDSGTDVGEALAQHPGAYEAYRAEMLAKSRRAGSIPRAQMR